MTDALHEHDVPKIVLEGQRNALAANYFISPWKLICLQVLKVSK